MPLPPSMKSTLPPGTVRPWRFADRSEDIEVTDDSVVLGAGPDRADAGDWDEAKHVRGPDGRFGEGGGSEHEASKLVGEALAHGGFTYRPGASAPKDGYIVSLPKGAGLNEVLEFKAMGRAATDREALRRELVDRVKTHLEKTAQHLGENPTHYLGGYVEKDEHGSPIALHLDVNEHEPDREKAIAAGRDRNQISIWDLGKSEEVSTGGTGR